jgi:hypothetical protein
MRGLSLLATLVAVGLFSGCTHRQLRWNTTHQAQTLTDIYEQQVLDNLAMFVRNPNSTPFFAFPNAGAADVTDSGGIEPGTTWDITSFAEQTLGLNFGREMNEGWTLQPVYDVRRLELMRCAYQIALANSGMRTADEGCPNCDKLLRAFYLGDVNGKYNEGDEAAGDDLSTWSAATGRTTPACFNSEPWICFGDKKAAPKKRDCCKVGHYCGTYVWLGPCGQAELSKLTMVILDYAFSEQAEAAAAATKDVVWYFDENGLPTARSEAAQEIRATLEFDANAFPPVTLPDDSNTRETDDEKNRRLKESERMLQRREDTEAIFSTPRNVPSRLPRIQSPSAGYGFPGGITPRQLQLYQRTLAPN